MNTIKRLMGILWISMGPILVYFMSTEALKKIAVAAEGVAKTNTTLQWGIILLIFIPISVGMMIFGYYAIKGEYDHLPETSSEITD